MRRVGGAVLAALVSGMVAASSAWGQLPDHPIITEVFQEPRGLGGPVGRDPADPHQEFIEIYLPVAADLAPGLDKDALNLAFYDVEGDSTSPGLTLVNYRIDLPTFDLDPSNGLTGLPRPTSGIVVMGWVDYVGNPPTDLAGTPSSRLALINGGVVATTDFTFIAINGGHFGGTTNFPIPVAISHLDTVLDPVTGKIEQGSSAYLLVNRDDPGYTSICGQTDPAPCNSFPNLPAGNPLATSSLLDAFAANDDADFEVHLQPYAVPTGDNIDLEFVLPQGGAFSSLTPQVPEQADGYQRLLLDFAKTTEDADAGNDDPAVDAAAYIAVSNLGPFVPTPGRVPSSASGAVLSLADTTLQSFQVLTQTQARPGIVVANLGGHFGMDILAMPSAASNPAQMTFSSVLSSTAPVAQSATGIPLQVETFAATSPGYMESISVQLDATPSGIGDPPVTTLSQSVLAHFTAIDPMTGVDALGMPFQATAFYAVQGIADTPGVANDFAATSLGQGIAGGLGTTFMDSLGNGAALIDPLTNLADPVVVQSMVAPIPTDPAQFINTASASSTLVASVLGSAEVQSGAATYSNSFNGAQTRVKAREFILAPVPTTGGFTPEERVHYADAVGFPGAPASGLTDVQTSRDFELALLDTQLGPAGLLEAGASDDFGIVVRVAQTRPGASIGSGEFIFLSTMGGREGADIDTLDVPPHGNLMGIIYVDLDPLDRVLGVETIDRVYVVDGSGGGEVDILEVFRLPEPGPEGSLLVGAAVLALCVGKRRDAIRRHRGREVRRLSRERVVRADRAAARPTTDTRH